MKNGEPSRTIWAKLGIYNIDVSWHIYIFKTMNQRIGFLGRIFTGNHVFSHEMLSGVPVSTFPQTNLLN